MAKQPDSLINFTKGNLDSLQLPPAGKCSYFYDVKGNGLHIVVTSKGKKSFYIRRRVNGKNEKHCLGTYPDLSIEQARDKAVMFAGAVAFGVNPSEEKRILRGELTLGELFVEYKERHLTKARKTGSEIEKSFERYLGDWKNRKISTISHHDIELRHSDLGRKRGNYAANRAVEIIRAMYNKAIVWRFYKGQNPAIGITTFEERSRERVLQADEFERFFRALNDEDDDFRDFVMLTLLTGARKSNVLSMRWDCVNLKVGTWTIPAEESKNNCSQLIVLTEPELEILARRNQWKEPGEDYIFPGQGRTGHVVEIKRVWARFLRKSEIKDLHIHDLRSYPESRIIPSKFAKGLEICPLCGTRVIQARNHSA